MTIKQLKKLIKYLPNNMEVFIPQGDVLISACNEQSEVAEIKTEDEIKDIFLLVPCGCHEEIESEVSPELN